MGVPAFLGSKPSYVSSVSLNNQTIPIRHLKTHTALHPSFMAKESRSLWLFSQRAFPPGPLSVSRLRDRYEERENLIQSLQPPLRGGISVLQKRKQAHRSEMICPSCTTSL